jgi:molybdopterin synthase sulfur carrier subunit
LRRRAFSRHVAATLEIEILPFAQARDLLGFASRVVPCAAEETPRAILTRISHGKELGHFRVALDCEYAEWDTPVGSARELAIIPPVSGG